MMISCFRTEKNATYWSKDKLKELLTGLVVETSDGMYFLHAMVL